MRKILFNDQYGLTDAVLQGRKTMTRRMVGNRMTEDDIKAYLKGYTGLANIVSPYKIGEVVAVAQSYKSVFEESLNYAIPRYHWLDDHIDEKGYANKMFVKAGEMPHQIRITNIKVERLQEISDSDIIMEGCLEYEGKYFIPTIATPFITAREAFSTLIEKVSGRGTWSTNPYAFVYKFELVK